MSDFSEIKKSLLKIYPFTDEQLELFANKLRYKKLVKNDLILKEQQLSDKLIFVLSGSLRFYVQKEYNELTLNFVTEHFWFADIESLLIQKPSENRIEAAEDSNIATISMIDMHTLMDLHSCFRMLYGLLANLSISSRYIDTITNKNPDERYRELLVSRPDWIIRFPQKQIASFLKMTPETLSRVRARIK